MFERLFRILLPFLLFLLIVIFIFPYVIMVKICGWIGLISIVAFFIIEFLRGDLDNKKQDKFYIDYEQYQKDNPYWMYPTNEEPTPWNDNKED